MEKYFQTGKFCLTLQCIVIFLFLVPQIPAWWYSLAVGALTHRLWEPRLPHVWSGGKAIIIELFWDLKDRTYVERTVWTHTGTPYKLTITGLTPSTIHLHIFIEYDLLCSLFEVSVGCVQEEIAVVVPTSRPWQEMSKLTCMKHWEQDLVKRNA